jgi:hypothetical protein
MFIEKIGERNFESLVLKNTRCINNSAIRSKDLTIFKSKIILRSSIQKLIFNKSNDCFYNNVFKPLILDASIRSESASGGSGDICLDFILSLIEESLRIKNSSGHIHFKNLLEEKMNMIKSSILSNTKKLEKTDLDKILKNKLSNENKKILKEALSLSGGTYTIIVEKSKKRETSIALQAGSCFSSPSDINDYIFGIPWLYNKVNCLVVDGIIESVSEIHHLLEKAAETSLPFVIFCRSVSDEVSHTIKTNLKRGTINLIPVCVGLDENTLNILNDISIVTGCEIVSSTKGDLISSAVKNRVDIVDSISIDEKTISIHSSGNENKIKNQIRYLRKKKNNTDARELNDLFDKRIKALMQGKVKISAGTSLLSKDPAAIEEIDSFLRNLKSLISFGVVNIPNMKKSLKISDNFDKIIIEYLCSLPKVTSSLGLLVGIKYSFSCLGMLSSVGSCLIEERKK